MLKTDACNGTLSAEEAKKLFFEHWDFLTRLARKRFPNDVDMGDQAMSYVLDKLEEQEWQRIRTWDGKGSFATFLGVLVSRQMTDFVRSRFGYLRPPVWLKEKKDPAWQQAFKMFAVAKLERQEAIESLCATLSHMNRDKVEEIVNVVYAKCTKQARFSEGNIGIELVEEVPSPDDEMQEALNNKQLIEVLLEFIQSEADTTDDLNDENIKELLSRLRTQLDMSDEDRLLLRLRFCEGLKVNEISQRLHLKGNLYKRINGLIENLKSACQQCGLVVS